MVKKKRIGQSAAKHPTKEDEGSETRLSILQPIAGPRRTIHEFQDFQHSMLEIRYSPNLHESVRGIG